VIVQIYEIQTPGEAEQMAALGVDHIGSVVLSEENWKVAGIRETLEQVRSSGARSSLIPLFSRPESILRLIDFYRPDIIHFCEALTDRVADDRGLADLIKTHRRVRKNFPEIRIMRSIPIARAGGRQNLPTLELARRFAPFSDYLLTDTVLVQSAGAGAAPQPVKGFIGITGRCCDWDVAAELAAQSAIPVILAGGISPDNAAAGIKKVRPYGIDSCTGTNAHDPSGRRIRFKKDIEKIKRLVAEMHRAEAEIKHSAKEKENANIRHTPVGETT